MQLITKITEMTISLEEVTLKGDLYIPDGARGMVIFSHGSGSSRLSSRNRFVARVLQQKGLATLLFDLLTQKEDLDYQKRFDIELLTRRLVEVTQWVMDNAQTRHLSIGYFGASTGAASALIASAILGSAISTVVSRGGRPDLALDQLDRVQSPTLLIVGGRDHQVIKLNRQAYAKLSCKKEMIIVPGASHLFAEPGKLDEVAVISSEWFKNWL